MSKVFTINGYTDYDIESVMGIFSSSEKADEAIKKWNKTSDCVLLEEVSPGKYKDHNSSSSEEYDYWIKPVKLDGKL